MASARCAPQLVDLPGPEAECTELRQLRARREDQGVRLRSIETLRCACRTLTLHSHLSITFSQLDPFHIHPTQLTDAQEKRRGSLRRVSTRPARPRCSAMDSSVGGGLLTRPRVLDGSEHARDGVARPCCGCGASGAARGVNRARCDPVLHPYYPCCPRAIGDSRICHGE